MLGRFLATVLLGAAVLASGCTGGTHPRRATSIAPYLADLPHLYDLQFISGAAVGNAPRLDLAGATDKSDRIALVRVVGESIAATWTPYPPNSPASGPYFGVSGESQLAVEEVLEGDAASVNRYLSQPFFIVADNHCQPAVALGPTLPALRAPVFEGEEVVLFVGRPFDVVAPIDAQGWAYWPGAPSAATSPGPLRRAAFLDAIRLLFAQRPHPSPTP